VIERLQRLWEWRETQAENDRELAAFSWWFLSKALPEDWAVTHLCKAVELTDDIEMPYQVTERLAALAERYPKESLAIIDALTKEDSGGWSRSALVDHAPPIVAAALRSQDVDLHEGARRLMDKLGRAGHIGFKRRVDSLLDSYSDA
jgi:hypothetical protein